jgi:hypothetical protein
MWIWAQNFQIFNPCNSNFDSFVQIQEHFGLVPKPSEVAYTLYNPQHWSLYKYEVYN